ncbi:hypothetical protein BWD12_11945 [Leptospira santarosai serovar Bananal]|nr:hypothetical protein BWD11_05315 [Leptospira santarosai serovar Grippotyphosa]ONF78646.1 hypothetical protein BWD12_11945 [Leptospira santarosai serovar Bananal]
MYSTLPLRSRFSETGLSTPVNKLKERNVIQSITLSSNLLTTPPSLAALVFARLTQTQFNCMRHFL